MNNLHDHVYSEVVLRFVNFGKDYTDLLSVPLPEERRDFISRLLEIMPAMYSAIMEIPVTSPVFEEGNEKFVSEEEWSGVYQKMAALLGSQNEYVDIPEEDEYDRLEVISRDLSEDLSDIYQDIKDFLELYRNGNEEIMNDALWECRMNCERYWGEKALRASRILHKIYVRDPDELEQMDREWKKKYSTKQIKTDEWFISRRQKDYGENE